MRFLSALADLPPVKPPSSWELRSRMGRRPSSSARKFEQGSGSSAEFLRLAQVVYTLTQFETIDRVSCQLEGEGTDRGGQAANPSGLQISAAMMGAVAAVWLENFLAELLPA